MQTEPTGVATTAFVCMLSDDLEKCMCVGMRAAYTFFFLRFTIGGIWTSSMYKLFHYTVVGLGIMDTWKGCGKALHKPRGC
jgi:hypothetical protein